MSHPGPRGAVTPTTTRRPGRRTWLSPAVAGLVVAALAGPGAWTGRTLAAWADSTVLPTGAVGAAAVLATTTTADTPDGGAVDEVTWALGGDPLHLSIRNSGTVAHDLLLVVGPLEADGMPPTTARPRTCPGSVWRTAQLAVAGTAVGSVCRAVGPPFVVDVPAGTTTELVLSGSRSGVPEPLHVVALDSTSGRFVDTAVVVVPAPAATAVAPSAAP